MRLVLFLALSLLALPAWATTYYVRPDGGTATQCLGTSDAAYDGSGSDEACAFKNLTYALGINGGAAAEIAGGDTVIVKNGSYPIGYHVDHPISGCTSGSASSCYMRPPPSGLSTSQRTRILGENSEAGCKTRPELWGTYGTNRILNIQSSSNIEYACLEITDHATCATKHHDAAMVCAAGGAWANDGVRGQAASNYLWRDINLHGIARFGFYVSGLTDWTLERVRIHGNAYGGWNGEISGSSSTADSNSGALTFKRIEVSFNGCIETYPSLTIVGCWGQYGATSSGNEGYGDGFGTYHTDGTWLFEDSTFHHNSSDGLDMRYLTGATANITVRRVHSFGNAGNQIKTSGVSVIENSVLVGNCDYFGTRYLPAMNSQDNCRASGNTVSLHPRAMSGVASTIRFSTITGKGDVMVNVGTDAGARNTAATSATIVRIENSIIHGQTEYKDSSTKPNVAYVQGSGSADGSLPTIQWYNNHVTDVVGGSTYNTATGVTLNSIPACPSGSYCAATPQLKSLSITAFDARPTVGSNVLGQGTNCGGSCTIPATDLKGKARPAAPARGALEL